MTAIKNQNTLRWLLRIALVLLNGFAIVMLVLKLAYGSVSNDELIAIMIIVFLGNIALAYVKGRKKELR